MVAAARETDDPNAMEPAVASATPYLYDAPAKRLTRYAELRVARDGSA